MEEMDYSNEKLKGEINTKNETSLMGINNGNDASRAESSTSSKSCGTPTPKLWTNSVIAINKDDSVGAPSPNQNGYYESPEEIKDSLQRDLEFIMKYALDAEPDVLFSLLASEVDNPNRLEFVLHDTLDLEIEPKLIAEYRKSNFKTGDKRSSSGTIAKDSNDVKKRKVSISELAGVSNKNESQSSSSRESSSGNEGNSSLEQNIAQDGESLNRNNGLEEPEVEGYAKNEFLYSLREMFPDADGLFLISESQQIKNWDECSRFINTVMLSGLYPKKGAKDDSWKTITPGSNIDDISKTAKSSRNGSAFVKSDIKTAGSSDVDRELVKIVQTNNIINNGPKTIPLIDLADEGVIGEKIDLPISSDYNFKQPMADESNFVLGYLNEPPAAPQSVPSTSNVNKKKRSPALRNIDVETIVSSTSEDLRNAAAQPSTSRNIIKLPSVTRISSTNVNSTVKTRPPGPSTPSTSRPKIEPSKSIQGRSEEETAEKVANKPASAEEEKAAKENQWIEEQTVNLVRIFPDTDPTFLKAECAKMECSDNALNEFVVAKLEQNDMPSRAEYEKRVEMEELQNRYTKNFVVEDFLKAIPDPWTFFSDAKRDCSKYKQHSSWYLRSSFRRLLMKDILDALSKNNNNLYLAYQHLTNNVTRQKCGKRTKFECSNNMPTTIDIQFLQEVAFIENEEKIKDYLEVQRLEKELKFEEARRNNNLLECRRCFDNEVLVEDTVYCPNDHNFCKNCVIRSVEVKSADGRHQVDCLLKNCKSQFSLSSLQSVLKPEVFSTVIQAIQMEEIKAAGIEDLVQCPFCNYATILPPEEKIMTCFNPGCLKESCRLCKELNHIPLRCEEVKKSEDVKLKTYIENKITLVEISEAENKPMTIKLKNEFVKELPQIQEGIHDVTAEFGSKIEELMNKSILNFSVLGQRFNAFKVIKVNRIFYKDKFCIYLHHQLEIEKKKPPPLGFNIDSTADWMIPMLNNKANEFFLFHGTQPGHVDNIAKGGFDDRVSRGGLYGRGTYFAENADKSDQYTTPNRKNQKYMFLARVTLGNPYQATVTGHWCRPPEINAAEPTKLHDSIVALSQRKSRVRKAIAIHQEFVIFDRYQCFPEFVIEYRRV